MPGEAIILLVFELITLAAIVLTLFWWRHRISLGPLYVTLGVFQPVQVLLSSAVYVEVVPGLSVSPGTLMFAASLLAILLIFIREDAVETRKVIYGIIGANFAMTIVLYLAGLQLEMPGTTNDMNLAPILFNQGARVTAVGTIVFVIDVMLLLVLYTSIRRRHPRRPFTSAFATLAGVLVFDAVVFTTGVAFERSDFLSLLYAAVLSKLVIAVGFAAALILYLRLIEPSELPTSAAQHPLRDFFYAFTYREKFEWEAEKAKAMEARLSKAQQMARMGFLDWDPETDTIYWSDEMLRLVGSAPGENLQTMESTLQLVHADDREQVRSGLLKARDGKSTYSLDHRLVLADGKLMWVHSEGEFIEDDSDKSLRFIGTIVDITRRKHAELERQQIFSRITDAFVALDQDWNLTYINPKAKQMFGRESQDMTGKNLWQEFPEAREQRFDQVCRQAMAEQKPAFLEAYNQELGFWFESRIYPSPEGVTMYFHDISERKLAEQKIKELNEELEARVAQRTAQLEAANKELEAFSYSVSHDLRAPLRAISGFAQIIARRHRVDLNEEGQRYTDHIVTASERMAQLIDDLLGYAKLGRRALGTSAVSLDEVLTHLKSELSQRLREEGGQLHIAKDLPVVNGDPTLLGQVFSNLIQNALTYRAADRPAQVTVDWERSANSVLVHVRDHGIGIAPEHLEKIFNVFQRLHSDEEFAGTGIGLAVVHKALKLLGGSIQVSSEPGNGSVFSVKLPAPPAATE